jgi:8-oxo-dGTP diphosphatase
MSLPNTTRCPHCGRYNNRAVTMDAVIVNDKNQILLVKRGNEPFKGLWSNAGGYLDHDETTEEATTREVKEETGLDVESIKFLNVYTNPNRHPNQAISVAYVVKVTGEPKAADDAVEVKWFDLTNLPKPLAFDHEIIIGDYLLGIAGSDDNL